MDYFDFRKTVKSAVESAVHIRKQNCLGLKSSLDVYALVEEIDDAIGDAIDKALPNRRKPEEVRKATPKGHKPEEVMKALPKRHKPEEIMNWMRTVEDRVSYILRDLKEEFKNKGKRCCGWCPNLKSQHQLSTEADQYVQYVAELIKKINRAHEEALSKTEQKVAAAAVQDFVYFDSRRDVWEEIMVALQSPRIRSIGVYGEAGVGKTMLVEEIKRKAEQLKLFDDVIMAKVTNNPDMRRIQDDIVHDLDLELPDRVTAANRIKSRLTDRKVLVILDDIWVRIDLEEVGIPFGDKHKQKLKQPTEKKNEEISTVEEQKECILLMTSGDRDVLARDMEAHKIIEVGPLEEKEAWQLFEKIGGEQAKNLILQRTAENNVKIEGEQRIKGLDEIVKGCKQLPIAIATIASTLESKNLMQGRTTIRKLHSHQRPSKPGVKSEMSPSLCSAIKLRYGDLESRQLKQTLLLCSLMGHNAGIQDLLKYGIGLELFSDGANIEAARDEAVNLVGKLRDTFLLLDGGSNMHFDMHDLIQEVAILIASGDHDVLALRKDAAKKKLDKKKLKNSKWIYLSSPDANQVPRRLKCPQLTFFHLADKEPDTEIPDNFFRGAEGLRVLGLTRMHFSSMPASISLLVNLCTLRLDQSELGTNLGSIMGALKNLQVLSLVGCDIKELPRETKELDKLTLLDLSDCSKLIVIPPDVLKSLSQLEELYLGNSFDQWDDIKKHDKIRNASLDELTQLKNLTSLEVRIHDINMIPDDFFSIELKRCKICIGDVWDHWGSFFEHSKTLKLKHDGSIRSDKVKKLPNKVQELHLEKLNAVKDVFNELDQKGFQELKCLHVKNIDLEMEHLFFNPKKEIYSEVLPKLEVLFLHSLKGLQKIFHGQFEKPSLEKLRIITVTGCNRLKNLFSFSVAKQLHYLQEIRVTDCSDIVEIVDDEEEEDANGITAEATYDVIELAAQIQCLTFQHLGEFLSFSQENIIRSSRTSLFNEKLVARRRIWNLKKLIIEGCDQLENLFFESIAGCLKKLEHLEIRECKKMREIIVREAGKGMFRFIFPSLKLLAIENCPELKGFLIDDHAEKYITSTALFHDNVYFPTLEKVSISNLKNLNIIWWEFEMFFCFRLNFLHIKDLPKFIRLRQNQEDKLFISLEQLTIENCPKLNGSLFDEKFVCPNLKIMTISHLENLKSIWENLDEDSFCNLRSLRVTYCQNLSTIFPCNSGMLKKLLGSLKELEIRGCHSVKQVFELGQSDITGRAEQAEKHKLTFHGRLRKLLGPLKELEIIGCTSVKQVFKLGQSDITRRAERAEEHKLIFQQLKVITIADCPDMVTFASTLSRDQEQETPEPFFSTNVEFPNLESLVMKDCHRFKYLMTLSTVQSFSQLKELVILCCKRMEEVIVTEEFTVANRISLFPKLNSMELEDLPELTRFCSEPQNLQASTLVVFPEVTNLKFSMLPKLTSFLTKNATEWPKLTSIHVRECHQVQIFALEFPSEDNHIESRTQEHPLFWVNKGLEGQEGSSGSNTIDLNQQGREQECSSRSSRIDMNQQELEGQEGSSRSSTIDMPAVSFMNLRTLDLSRCHGLVTVLRYTMAKRLNQLSTMSITDCSKLEEIVACEGNEVKDEIVFTKLTYLQLGLLSRLESFCSGKCNFSFPSLHKVILSECPEMSTFSKGVVKTEKLQNVKLTEEDDAGIWKDGDLNSSIQYLFINKNHPAAEPFKTKTLPHLDEFHGRNAQGANTIIEDKEKDDGQEKEQNEDDGLDHNDNKGENYISLDDSHPSVAQDAQESASKRNEVALSSKEKKRDEDATIVAQDAQEPDSKRAEGEPTAECIVNAARLLGNDIIKEINKELIKGIGSDVMLLQKSSKLDSALSKIEGLTEDERNIALRKLPDHPIQMLIFFSLSPDQRLALVRGFLMDH